MIMHIPIERLARSGNPASLGPYGRISLPPVGIDESTLLQWSLLTGSPAIVPRSWADQYVVYGLRGANAPLNDPRAARSTNRLIAGGFYHGS
jgi:hypothetical protein